MKPNFPCISCGTPTEKADLVGQCMVRKGKHRTFPKGTMIDQCPKCGSYSMDPEDIDKLERYFAAEKPSHYNCPNGHKE